MSRIRVRNGVKDDRKPSKEKGDNEPVTPSFELSSIVVSTNLLPIASKGFSNLINSLLIRRLSTQLRIIFTLKSDTLNRDFDNPSQLRTPHIAMGNVDETLCDCTHHLAIRNLARYPRFRIDHVRAIGYSLLRHVETFPAFRVADVVGGLGRAAGGGIVDEKSERDAAAERVVNGRFAHGKQAADLPEAALDAVPGDVLEVAALGVLVVDDGAAPAALVDAQTSVEDVVGGGFEVIGIQSGGVWAGEARGLEAAVRVLEVGDADHGLVEAFDPVGASVPADALHVGGFLWQATKVAGSESLTVTACLLGGFEHVRIVAVTGLRVSGQGDWQVECFFDDGIVRDQVSDLVEKPIEVCVASVGKLLDGKLVGIVGESKTSDDPVQLVRSNHGVEWHCDRKMR